MCKFCEDLRSSADGSDNARSWETLLDSGQLDDVIESKRFVEDMSKAGVGDAYEFTGHGQIQCLVVLLDQLSPERATEQGEKAIGPMAMMRASFIMIQYLMEIAKETGDDEFMARMMKAYANFQLGICKRIGAITSQN